MPTTLIQQQNIIKPGTCPHGMPMGACPICSGMGGGIKTANHTAKPGEMSWNECAAIGAMLRAQKNARLARENANISFAQKIAEFNKQMINLSQKYDVFTGNIAKTFPPIIAQPIKLILNITVGTAINIARNIPNIMQNLTQKITDISDKLAAVYGEIKTALAKKAGEILNSLKKKVKSLFGIFDVENLQNDDKKVDETKKALRLKTFIHKLYKKIKRESSDDSNEI